MVNYIEDCPFETNIYEFIVILHSNDVVATSIDDTRNTKYVPTDQDLKGGYIYYFNDYD